MFGFLASFFGSNVQDTDSTLSAEMARAADDLDLETAIASHANWKLRLQLYLSGGSQETFIPSIVCSDNHCDLGRWIYGKGSTHLGKYPGFSALKNHHKMFHLTASNIVSFKQAGNDTEAKKMLHLEFAELSQNVLGDLRLMQKIVQLRKL